ncbi:MAG TPA: hypothetical protein VF297_21500 [Pyrinomonadaceae bacterium]
MLFELDASGKVLYFKPEKKEASDAEVAELVGLNFFTDVPAVAGAEELRERFHGFRRGHAPAGSFIYNFPAEHWGGRAKVMLARVHEQSVLGNVDSILVDIREAA